MTDSFQAGRYTIPILYQDNHLFVIAKPPNMPTQADSSGDLSALDACKAYIASAYHKPGKAYLGLVHRLDRPVGGVMVFARTSKAASRLSEAFRARTVEKEYLAVVEGALPGTLTLTDTLMQDEKTGRVHVVAAETPGAKRAELITEPVWQADGRTLVRVRLLTGRKHQIRVQHAHAGYPVWGDQRYGRGVPGEQIALWAYRVQLQHPTTKETLTFVAPPPSGGAWAAFTHVQLERGCDAP